MKEKVLNFWFTEISEKDWFIKNEEFDQRLKSRFLDLHTAAKRNELYSWRNSVQGRLAEIIVLDQFSRNIFRNQFEAFAQDPLALSLAQEAVSKGDAKHLTEKEKSFLFLPYMHSESLKIHEEFLRLLEQNGINSGNLYEYELKHKVIIDRFGRYPHRNNILNRPSTPEEIQFLQSPNSSF